MSNPIYPDNHTNRVEACLKLKVPKSGVEWIDELILECRHLELIENAATALCGKIKTTDGSPLGIVNSTIQFDLAGKAEDYIQEVLQRKKQQ
jgi:hypothetical protein